MYQIIRIGVVSLYVLLTGVCFLLALAISGVYISWLTFLAAMAGWVSFCFLSVYIRGPVHLFFYGRLRKPIMEEELKMQGCFMEVLKSADCRKKFRLRIAEVKGDEAFAYNSKVIAVSKELLDRLTEDELKGVLAHELGHLISKDTMITWAFVTAGELPGMVRRGYRMVRRICGVLLMFAGMLAGLVLLILALLLVLVFLFLFKPFAVLPVMAIVLFLVLFWMLDRLFRWLRLVLSRQGEYRQDAYAHSLGYGAGLREALKKIAQYGREHVNAYFILMNGTHPVIYDRIRRLEQMIGLRINK